MNRYKLEYLALFSDDLNQIIRYISFTLKNPNAAENLMADVENAIYRRLEMPEAYSAYPTTRNRDYPYYTIRVRNFIIFYVVIGNTMQVRRIIYQHRNIAKLI